MLVDHLLKNRISSWPKAAKKRDFLHLGNRRTYIWTDGPMDRRTDGLMVLRTYGQTLLKRCVPGGRI